MSGRFQILVATTLFLFTACNMHIDKRQTGLQNASWYTQIEDRVIKPSCISCHSGAAPADDIDLSSYDAVLASGTIVKNNADASPFYKSVLSGKMPKGKAPLAAEDIALIKKWIDAGAGKTNVVIGPEPTFTWLNDNVFKTRCLVCHNSAKPRGNVDFSDYESIVNSKGHEIIPIIPRNPEKSGVYLEVAELKMPPKPRSPSTDEVNALTQWILKGAPEATPGIVLPGPGEPNPPQPAWEWLSKNTLRRCASCHGIPFKVANVDLTTYQTLMESKGGVMKPLVPGDLQKSGIYVEILTGHMPPPPKFLNEAEIATMRAWIDAGAPNN